MKKSLTALALGTLALGVAEFVMMGILPDVALDLGISIPRAGSLISVYAVGVCVGAPLTVVVARRRGLKSILLALAAVIATGNLLAALAPDYGMLAASRFVAGLPHGAFFGGGSIVAERVAEPGRRTEAVSIMILGMTVANLFCVPLGTFLGNILSWRWAFVLAGGAGIAAAVFVACWVPRLPALPDNGLRGQFRFLTSSAPWLILGATLLANAGVFCWYSYVMPVMSRSAAPGEDALAGVMFVAGLGMFAGNLAGGRCADRFTPERTARFIQGALCLLLLALLFAADCG
ncbi:MAG: MFS transporter, partial [Alistipes sp.]|nr:MFS transporter [Alistipes sp.]